MTRYERLRKASLDEVVSCFCYFFAELTNNEYGCDCCPGSDKCHKDQNGIRKFLLEETEL